MKTTINDLNITYPDLGFAFNPIRVFIDGFTSSGYISITANKVTIERETSPYLGSISFDLSAIARSLFNRLDFHQVKEQDTSLFKTIEFEITDKHGLYYQGVIPVIWGALQIGERYTQNKTLTYFPGYPFTLPLYLDQEVFLQASIDDGDLKDIGLFEKGKLNVNLPIINAKKSVFLTSVVAKHYKIFDYTFDFTFGPQRVDSPTELNITIKISYCTPDGVYLRWINKHGEYNYYLFQSGQMSSTTKSNSISFDSVYYSTDLTGNYHQGTGKNIGKDIENNQKLFASLIDSQTYDFLIDLVESPVVDMFLGYDTNNIQNWVSVSVADGSFSKSSASLQDFELSLIPNKKLVQTL